MTWKRVVARTIGELCSLSLWRPRPGFRILLYHSVGTRLAHDTYGISIAPDLFERHMAALAECPDWKPVSLHPETNGGPGLEVTVTFDDGYRDNLYIAAPILQRYNIPFSVFVTTEFINRGAPYLSEQELRELAAIKQVTIASHGATHTRLTRCDDRELWNELDGSRRRLEDLIGRPVAAIAYPHGSVDRRVAEMAKEAGYTTGLSSHFNINTSDQNPLLLCRTEILADDSVRVFRQKVAGAWDWRRWRST